MGLRTWGIVLLLAAPCSASAFSGQGPWALSDWQLAPAPGAQVELVREDGTEGIRFLKTGPERRLLALEARPSGPPGGVRSLQMKYRLRMDSGSAPRAAVVVHQTGGGTWFAIGNRPLEMGRWAVDSLSLLSPRQAAFSVSADTGPRWEQVDRVGVGLVVDGEAQGVFELAGAFLSEQPYRSSQPLPVTCNDPALWSVACDPAVSARLTAAPEGADGGACLRFEFALPGGRHMYALPTTSIPGGNLEGYRALSFSYRAALPEGISGLLVILAERDGSQYYADPAPPASAGWDTVTLPLDSFRRGEWSTDENDRLDLQEVLSLIIGLHGTAAAERGEGAISVTRIEFIP